MTAPPRVCGCGHDEDAHEHWRAGTECSLCGPDLCPGFRVPDGPPPVSPELRRVLAVAVGVPTAIVVIAAAGKSIGGQGVPASVAVLVALIGGAAVWYLVRR